MPFTLTGSQVRHLREITGVTQTDLARALGYSKSAVCRWERRGDTSIPRPQYQRVLDYLRSRYDVAEGQRVQTQDMLQRAVNH